MRLPALAIALFTGAAGLWGCVSSPAVYDRAGSVEKLTNEQHVSMVNCTPRELARAEAFADFARHETSQGRPHTARDFIELSEFNARKAFENSRDRSCLGDLDGDGIPDPEDRCPEEKEDFDKFKDKDGCPEPDNDLDGILDPQDRCPNEAGPVKNEGCPFMDRDGDGLSDDEDKCPDEFGPRQNHGCPIRDSDKDGVPDNEDKCPQVQGPKDNEGCPYKLIQVTDKAIILKEKIFFAFGKSTIRRTSHPLLNEVVLALRDHPTYVVRIEGHTDSVGRASSNQRLSTARAVAVRKYLLGKGVAPRRLQAVGLGEARPIDDNSTEAGRSVNRRVEFHIVSK
ncbi:MAG: OmpA family protein [Deltaproteobacteria bacterium]|nr:OmpA family protein [Deltaproteobacteria bacterium]